MRTRGEARPGVGGYCAGDGAKASVRRPDPLGVDFRRLADFRDSAMRARQGDGQRACGRRRGGSGHTLMGFGYGIAELCQVFPFGWRTRGALSYAVRPARCPLLPGYGSTHRQARSESPQYALEVAKT